MTFLTKLGENAKVFDAFQTWPEIYKPWGEVCQQVLRDYPSNFTAGEREMIGTFVSRLNQCEYCYHVHNSATREYGFDEKLVDALKDDIESASVDEKMKPVLKYVRKLTLEQYKMTQKDADAVLEAGWSEDDLHLAISIAALFAFMNRFVHGLGIEEDPEYSLAAGPRLKAMGYKGSQNLSKEDRDAFAARSSAAE